MKTIISIIGLCLFTLSVNAQDLCKLKSPKKVENVELNQDDFQLVDTTFSAGDFNAYFKCENVIIYGNFNRNGEAIGKWIFLNNSKRTPSIVAEYKNGKLQECKGSSINF